MAVLPGHGRTAALCFEAAHSAQKMPSHPDKGFLDGQRRLGMRLGGKVPEDAVLGKSEALPRKGAKNAVNRPSFQRIELPFFVEGYLHAWRDLSVLIGILQAELTKHPIKINGLKPEFGVSPSSGSQVFAFALPGCCA